MIHVWTFGYLSSKVDDKKQHDHAKIICIIYNYFKTGLFLYKALWNWRCDGRVLTNEVNAEES